MFVMVLVLLLLKKELCISLAFLIGVIHKVLHIQRTKFVFLEEILLSIESNRLLTSCDKILLQLPTDLIRV